LFAEVAHQMRVAAAVGFGQAVHLARLCAQALACGIVGVLLGHAIVGLHVGPRVEEHAVTRQTVAARAADLLVVALDRARQIAVDDEAHVRLVDTHAEGNRRGHDVDRASAKVVLSARALGRIHPRVVVARRDARFA
jgi:hypothetical protein